MKRGRFIRVFILLFIFSAGQAWADGYESMVARFFQELSAGKAESAVDDLYATNRWISSESDAIINLKTQLVGVGSLVGQYHGVEKIAEYTVGSRFVYLSYMALYDRQPLRFIFEFYKPKEQWRVFSFSFDDDLDDDLEEQAKRSQWFTIK